MKFPEADNASPTAQPAPVRSHAAIAVPAPAQTPKRQGPKEGWPKPAKPSRRRFSLCIPSPPAPGAPIDEAGFAKAHASPSVRKFARELGVNLGLVKGTGPKQRILKEDVQAYVKAELSKPPWRWSRA